jgi:hypothetical protein
MYKRAGRFFQGLAQRDQHTLGSPKRSSSLFVETPESRLSQQRELVSSLDAEVASVTPSLRKRQDVPSPVILPRRSRGEVISGQRVYLVLFTLRTNRTLQFLKIGVSAFDLLARFQQDRQNYDFVVIAESEAKGSDAFKIETAFHRAFFKDRIRPKVPLASGNTECYRYTEETMKRMADILSAIGSDNEPQAHGRQRRKPKVRRQPNTNIGEKCHVCDGCGWSPALMRTPFQIVLPLDRVRSLALLKKIINQRLSCPGCGGTGRINSGIGLLDRGRLCAPTGPLV